VYLSKGTELHKRYRIEGLLGHGGFGITYLSRDLQLNIHVAVKEYLPRQLAGRSADQRQVSVFSGDERKHFEYGLKRFLDEAQAIARFDNHPNIVNVKDYFEENDTAYMVMSYVEGVNLKTYLERKGGKLPFELALSIMMPVMDALREVHGAGILHRDVSPDNVYLATSGQVILLDFGAARYFTTEYSHSISLILKAGYAPEEQYRRRGKQGAWTDAYSTAATLYRAITGEAPPEAPDRKEHDTLIPPSQLGVKISPAAEQALLKAMAIRAENRYRTIQEFQQEIGRAEGLDETATFRCQHCQALNDVPANVPWETAKCEECGQPLGQAGAGGKPRSQPSSRNAFLGVMRQKLCHIHLGRNIGIILLAPVILILGYFWIASGPSLTLPKFLRAWPSFTPRPGPSVSATRTVPGLPPPLPPGPSLPRPSTPGPTLAKPLPPPAPLPEPEPPPAKTPAKLPEAEAYDYFNKGLAAHDPSQKILFFQRAIELNPHLAEAYNQLGKTYYERKELSQALKYYSKAIEIKPDFADCYNNLGVLYYDFKDYTKAMNSYNKAIKLYPFFADAYCNRGILFMEMKKFNKAQEDFTKAINNKNDLGKAYYNRAIIYYLYTKDYARALADFNNAVKCNYNDIEAIDYRGVLYFKFKDYDRALADFNQVIAQKPAYADPYYNRGRIYHHRKQYQLALKDYREVISLNPRFAEAFFALGRLYDEMGDKDRAKEEYKQGKALRATRR
jgi:serine/threonine protein kinase/tetratricopeptide (TPR) repeat protein